MYVAPCLLLVVMVLGHLTVWVAALAGLGAIWWLAGRKRRGNKAGVLVPVGIGALVLAALFVLAPQSTVTREFERSVAETQQKNSTLAWRVDSWKSLLNDWAAGGPLVWPAGKPFGSGNRRYIEAQRMETNVSAHSHYISLLIRGGLLVLFAYVAGQLLTLRRLRTRPVDAPPWLNAEILAVFFIANMVYALAYGPDYMQALFMGLGYTLAARAGAAPAGVSPAPASSQVMSDASRRLAHLS
jgi:O-antigen ligase